MRRVAMALALAFVLALGLSATGCKKAEPGDDAPSVKESRENGPQKLGKSAEKGQ